ncbi:MULTISPECIES: hypothetical protein [Bacillus]|uniref:hypothetical protein n=1 Tax=Bacillus TaxID=1386 RepID=UPI0011A8269B|nr:MULTISPECIES: hypothetical protein [Bacillus]MBL3849951.1 hypothetical protein [Bacillus cereus]MDA1525322.1 hypothetical protein [Bacillus cereus]MDA1611181.1 hypothetical protein [Bacillus cereus]MDR4407254.1 hypothetical protein [Bacillus anthracis]MEC3528625.1 hypothetical protein [Bacillus paranthracis]
MDIAKSPYFYSEIVSFVLKKITAQDLWDDSSRVLIKEKRYWNNQYSTQLKRDLKVNFTEENLKHFAEVLQMLLVQKEFDKQNEREMNKRNSSQKREGIFDRMMNQNAKFAEQAFKNFYSNFEKISNIGQSMREEIKQRDSNSDIDSIYKNSRKR